MRHAHLLPPPDLGLPEKFAAWRPAQDESVLRGIEAQERERFVAQAMPTGSGKSLGYIAQAHLTGKRTCVLTSTKGLQDQISRDFAPLGIADIRGKNAYRCPGDSRRSCEDGPCLGGLLRKALACPCPYFAAYKYACAAQIVVTNYAYWVAVHRFGEGLGDFDLLVLDEAHAAPDELAGAMEVLVRIRDLEEAGLKPPPPLPEDNYLDAEWRAWARACHARSAGLLALATESVRQNGYAGAGDVRWLRILRNLTGGLELLAQAEGPWIGEEQAEGWHFSPLWAAQYGERYLFRDIPSVLLVSATVRPKTLELLGCQHGQFDFQEYPSTFPAQRAPIYHIPTVRMDYRATPEQVRTWLTRIDQIIRPRLDRKGIVHTVSFKRRDLVVAHSEFARHMVSNSSYRVRGSEATTARVVERFKAMAPPAILVSPSLSTGYDFPYQECEFQVIGKVPFPDTQSRIMRARQHEDPQYTRYIAAQELVQACGRGMRAGDDQCETLITDDHIAWFLGRNRSMVPAWFFEFFRWVDVLPPPLEKLT